MPYQQVKRTILGLVGVIVAMTPILLAQSTLIALASVVALFYYLRYRSKVVSFNQLLIELTAAKKKIEVQVLLVESSKFDLIQQEGKGSLVLHDPSLWGEELRPLSKIILVRYPGDQRKADQTESEWFESRVTDKFSVNWWEHACCLPVRAMDLDKEHNLIVFAKRPVPPTDFEQGCLKSALSKAITAIHEQEDRECFGTK